MADKEDKKVKKVFDKARDLTGDELKSFNWVEKRIPQLQDFRKDHYGTHLDTLWSEADRDCVPHRLGTTGKRVIATDETKGWRGTMVKLGDSNWQSDNSQNNPFVKIQVALSILIDRNPSGVFSAAAKKYQGTTALMKQLYEMSWGQNNSKAQLKLFVYNLAKYGWACARSYPDIRSKYQIKRENLDPRNTWMDDMARPNDSSSIDDWAWRKVYTLDKIKAEFPQSKFIDYVQSGGNTQDVIDAAKGEGGRSGKEFKAEDLTEVYFYESLSKNLFLAKAGNIPLLITELPLLELDDKTPKLSLWQTYWNLRHAESPYGVGIYEAIRYDNAFLDRIRNMTVDQIVMSIYKMFFFQGTQALTETGDITIKPGVGKQVIDPKNITWLDVPGPGMDAYKGIEMFRKDVDESSGIGPPLMGIVEGKTAFESAQAKESALGRIRTPLDNILEALNSEGYITLSLIKLLYSIPETYEIADADLIEQYMKQVDFDPELYERSEEIDEVTGETRDKFTAKVFPELPLNLDKDEKNNLIETDDTKFFRLRPKFLQWEGVISIKAQSLLTPSKQVDKALELEMYNMLIPLLAQPPEVYAKIGKAIVKLYDKDPKDLLPDFWLQSPAQQPQPLFVPGNQAGGQAPATVAPEAQTMVSRTQPSANPQSLIGKIAGRLTAPFR